MRELNIGRGCSCNVDPGWCTYLPVSVCFETCHTWTRQDTFFSCWELALSLAHKGFTNSWGCENIWAYRGLIAITTLTGVWSTGREGYLIRVFGLHCTWILKKVIVPFKLLNLAMFLLIIPKPSQLVILRNDYVWLDILYPSKQEEDWSIGSSLKALQMFNESLVFD